MGSSRRPARFTRPESVETNELTEKQLKSLRAAAARVFIDEENPKDKSSEVNTAATGSTNRKRKAPTSTFATFDDGVKMLAVAAMIIETKTDKPNNYV